MTIIGDKSDFVDYMNKIKTGTSEFALIMQKILFGHYTNT